VRFQKLQLNPANNPAVLATGAWLRLDWPDGPQCIGKVVLYDRAGVENQVTAGELSFSDGRTLPVGKLQNDGRAGTVVILPAKPIRWLKFTVTAVRPGTVNAGLGELEAYEPGGE
jgi:hypothetical protein